MAKLSLFAEYAKTEFNFEQFSLPVHEGSEPLDRSHEGHTKTLS